MLASEASKIEHPVFGRRVFSEHVSFRKGKKKTSEKA